MLVSIVLPCYNPPENWDENIVNKISSIKNIITDELEVVLIQDGKNEKLDNGIKRLKKKIPGFKYITYPKNRGKGYALRQGIEAANGEIIIYTDIDFPYTEESVFRIYSALKKDECDLAVGIKDDAYYSHVPLPRRILSKGLRHLTRFLLSIPITDTQCGLKGLRKSMKPVFAKTQIDRYLFDLEFIRISHKLGHRIKPIKITLNENVQFGAMNYRMLLGESLNFLKLLFSGRFS